MRRARLIVAVEGVLPFPQPICAWSTDDPIPAGYEEIHAVRPILADFCTCGHTRSHHVGHAHHCMTLGDDPCACKGFKPQEGAQDG